MAALQEVLFMGTQASEGQASSGVSGEKFSPCEAEPDFGAVGVLACPSCVAKDRGCTWKRGRMCPQGLGKQTSAAQGRMDMLSMEIWFLEIPSSLQPHFPDPSLMPRQLSMV